MSENKVIYDWANAEEAAKVIAEVRRVAIQHALQVATRLVCCYCERGTPELEFDEHYGYHHKVILGPIVMCDAHAIYEMLAAEQGQDEGQGE